MLVSKARVARTFKFSLVRNISSSKVSFSNLNVHSLQLEDKYFPKFEKLQNKNFINGKFVNAISGKTFETYNPATNKVITSLPDSDKADIEVAVKAASEAFYNGPWSKMDARDRGLLMYKLADLIERHGEELAKLESLDNGKPFKNSGYNSHMDIKFCVDCIRYYAGVADKIHGETFPIRGNFHSYTLRVPVGVCGQIIPWNFPLLMACWKLGPALACGNTTILKPAEQTSLTALRLAELIAESGFPPGVVNIVCGFGETAGRAIALHPHIDKVGFTGSTEVGHAILEASAASNLKRITLELGGKSPSIIFADANMDQAILYTHIGLFLNQGQCCIAGSRIYVEEKAYEEFIEKAVHMARGLKMGNPFVEGTGHGPQVDRIQTEKVCKYIESGKKEGAKLVLGGNRIGDTNFIEPTVFTDVKDHMQISREEIFGPVMSISKFRTIDEVLHRAHDSEYGLGGAVFTKDIVKALSVANRLRVGTTYVNCYDVFDAAAPFGGFKKSGQGRELGLEVLKHYTELKTVIVNLS